MAGRESRRGVIVPGRRAGRDTLCVLCPVPTQQESSPPRPSWLWAAPPGSPCLRAPGLRGGCALARLAGVPAEGARVARECGGGPHGGGDCGEGPGPPLTPAPPSLPTQSADQKTRAAVRPRARSASSAPSSSVESGEGGAPLLGHYPLLLRKPPVQLPARFWGQVARGPERCQLCCTTCRRPPCRGPVSETGAPPGRRCQAGRAMTKAAP